MANRRWLGKAKNISQVATIVVADTWATNDTITITIDGIDFVVTVGSLFTTAQVATTLKQAFNGETLTDTSASCSPTISEGGSQAINQLYGITASVSSSTVTLTGILGIPFTISAAASTAGDGDITLTLEATAATGKWHWNNADNWSGGAVPVDNDTVIFDSGNVDCRYALTASMQPALFVLSKGYRGKIGLPEINMDTPAKPYPEYRGKYLTFDDNSVTCTYQLFMEDGGAGSPLVRIDAGAGQAIFNIYGTASRYDAAYPNLLLLGVHVSNVLYASAGDAGVAFFEGESAKLVGLRAAGSARIVCGNGVEFQSSTVIDITSATVQIESATASSDIDINGGGKLLALGTAAHADIDVQSGTCDYRSSGTITTLRVGDGGLFDRSNDLRALTVTNVVNVVRGSRIKDPNKTMTLSAGIKFNGFSPDSNFDFGADRTYSIS